MVSKIAVMALVAIVATPILLGYAFNLSEVTETDYRQTGESVNVTELLQTGTGYTFANANIYDLNTRFVMVGQKNNAVPVYESITTTYSSLKLNQGSFTLAPGQFAATPFNNYTGTVYYSMGSNSHVTFVDLSSDGTIPYDTYYDVTALEYDSVTNVYHVFGSFINTYTPRYTNDLLYLRNDGTSSVTIYYTTYDPSDNHYVNMAAGFHLYDPQLSNTPPSNYYAFIMMPSNTVSALMTINLDSITDANYSIRLDNNILTKTTTGGVVNWTIANVLGTVSYDMYYDPTITDNSYQLYKSVDENNTRYEYRYVGHWPALIGEANYYHTYSFDFGYSTWFQNINFTQCSTTRTPTLRMDDALTRAFEYPVITNKTYDPAAFKENPITTINDPQFYGSSLTFGGTTYTITDGKISLSGHDVPLKGIKLSSTLNGSGTYDNKIGNTIVSTTAQPSTIAFNGSWSVNVSTISQESYTYSKTQWNAGSFGWDGVDSNFLIVGLITCLGVFIALGIYARKKGSGGIIPLMIVVGGAAMVFFVML